MTILFNNLFQLLNNQFWHLKGQNWKIGVFEKIEIKFDKTGKSSEAQYNTMAGHLMWDFKLIILLF